MMRSNLRASFLFALLGLGLVTVVARAIQFQLKPDDRLEQMAAGKVRLNQKKESEEALVSRGAILDREENDLALSIIVQSFFANPKLIKNPKQVARKLAPLLKQKVSKLEGLLSEDRYFVWLKREVDAETTKQIEVLDIDGIYSRKESKRIYPHGDLARVVIGTSGHDGVGLEGIEKFYDSYLRSSDQGQRLGIRDALGRLLLYDDFDKQWFNSHQVVLTLDLRLQKILEEELRNVLQEKKPLSAQGVMLNPKTGEILAMASLDGKRPDRNEFRNRIVTDLYEPGSTFKIILAAAAIEHLGMNAHSQVFGENGAIRVGNHTIREYNHHKYGWLSLQELLEVSSNVAAAKIGLKLGTSAYEKTIRRFGFGKKTGIDLPGEEDGILRSAASWKPVELANIGFGQGIAVTPLQMAVAVAAVANGGYLVRPYILSHIFAPPSGKAEQKVVFENRPDVREIIPAERARILTDMLSHITDEGSTGVAAAISGYRIAGKTGTSQKLVEKVNSRGKTYKTYTSENSIVSFVGYVPANDPAFVLLILYDDPEGRVSGGVTAAPTFRRVASRALATMGVTPDRKHPPRVQASPSETGRFVGKTFEEVLQEVKALPQEQRAKIDLIGYGVAVREEVDDDWQMKVYFK